MNKNTEKFLNSVDLNMLVAQKERLSNLRQKTKEKVLNDDLSGLIHFLDAFQDWAIKETKDKNLFGTFCPECGSFMKDVIIETDEKNLEDGQECSNPDCPSHRA